MADEEEFSYTRIMQEAYDGAATNYRLDQRGLLEGDSDALASRELKLLQQRGYHALRNNGWAATAKRKHRTNLGVIEVRWPNKRMQNAWNEFVADPNLDGYGNFCNTQDEWNIGLFDGEIFTRLLIKRRNKFTIPLVLQNIASEYLDPTYTAGNPETTRNGITFKDSRPFIYHFNKNLNKQSYINNADKVKVPADEVLHIFTRDRPGQWRGIPTTAPILLPLYQLDDLTDATIAKQQAAQAISWIVKNTNPSSAVAVGSAMTSLDANDIDSTTGKRRIITQASGGGVQYLNKGEDIAFNQGTDIGDNYKELVKIELRKVAKAWGLTYEVLTGDLSGVNLSALQWIELEMKIRAETIYKFQTLPLGLIPLCNRFKELAGLYISSNLANLEPVFQFPRRYGMNELKDAQADVLELQYDMTTLRKVLAERNLTMEEILEDKEFRKKNGLFVPVKQDSGKSANQANNVKPNSNTKG